VHKVEINNIFKQLTKCQTVGIKFGKYLNVLRGLLDYYIMIAVNDILHILCPRAR
jgi:hypothetical protein